MTITLACEHLTDDEQRIVTTLAAHVKKVYRSELAPFLFEQLQCGRAYVLDTQSAEFKGLTKWQ